MKLWTVVSVKLHSVYWGLRNKSPYSTVEIRDRMVHFDHIFCRSFLHESWLINIVMQCSVISGQFWRKVFVILFQIMPNLPWND